MAYNNLIDLTRLGQFLGKLKLLLNEKVDKETGKGLSTNDYTSAEKTKLSGIEVQANKTIVDSALSSSSTNPVQNSVIYDALEYAAAAADEIVIISDTQPTSDNNKLWAKATADGSVQVATYAELQALEATVSGKVDAVTGKDLSTNDYTDAEKTKLAGIAAGAQVNTLTGVKGDAEVAYRTGNVNITKGNIGLGNVENKSSATIRGELTSSDVTTALGYTPPQTDTTYETMTESEAETGTSTTGKLISAEVLDAAIENKGYTSNVGTITGITMNGASKGTSGVVDLGTVITAHQDISGKLDSSLKGAANGLAELGSDGKVPASQLPSYVDDVVEYAGQANFPTTGESGKIYVDTSANKCYRWSGSAYIAVASDLALGTTSSTAFRGDYGAAAYAHGITNKGAAFASGLYKVTTNAEGHVTDATAVQKSDITALGIPAQDTTYSNATTSAAGLMSSTDKGKLDGIEAQANKTVVDSALDGTSTNPVQNKIIKAALDAKGTYSKPSGGIPDADIASAATWNAKADTSVATTTANGLMSSADKAKLDGIDTQANKTVVDSALSLTSENPVQNKVIKSALDNKVSTESGKGLSSNDYTSAEKTKLSGIDTGAQVNVIETIKKNGKALSVSNKAVDIAVPTKTSDLTNDSNFPVDANYVHTDSNFTAAEKTKLANIETEANKTIVDSALSSSSTNPVQNKVVKEALDLLEDEVVVSDTQPSSANNRLWVNESLGDGISLATYAELQALQADVSLLESEVIVSDTQPTAATNQIWISETLGAGVSMATYAELQALEARVAALETALAALS